MAVIHRLPVVVRPVRRSWRWMTRWIAAFLLGAAAGYLLTVLYHAAK